MTLEWLNLLLRWVHVIFGVMWIGQTYLFNWMERVLTPPDNPEAKPNISGELWMVHGGGFYLVEKQKWPALMPRTLHWFKWEAGITWITGVLLLAVVYWAGSPLLEYGSGVGRATGIGLSLGVLVGGFIVYNLIWNSPLGNNEGVGIVVSWLLIIGLAYALQGWLSDRAVYLHIGAMFGTIMAANVWMRIIPSQKKMMAITEAGGTPDPTLGARAKRASKHNTFMSVPLMFTMISNHFPATTFGQEHAPLILGGMVLIGWVGAKLIRDYA